MNKEKLTQRLAQKAYVDIKTINDTSLSGVALTNTQQAQDISSLFSLISDLNDEIEALKTRLLDYENHTHNYNGGVDTTQGVN